MHCLLCLFYLVDVVKHLLQFSQYNSSWLLLMWSKRQYGYCLKVTLQIGQEWVCSLWCFLLVNSSSQWSHIISSSVNGWLFCVLCFFSASTSWVLSNQTLLASSPKILPFFWACWASNWDLAIDSSACFFLLCLTLTLLPQLLLSICLHFSWHVELHADIWVWLLQIYFFNFV